MTTRRPTIGVFDSGFGGLTVLRELLNLVPEADYLYFGDTARLPYGSKSVDTVARYAVSATKYLEERGAQMLVVACNTATALALKQIIVNVSVPVIGVIEPGAELAARESKVGRVVVIGTEATVCSHAYQQALEQRGVQSREKACPLLVPLVEEGWVNHPVTEVVAQIYINEAFVHGFKGADVLVLGCTHYPLIKPLLRRVLPGNVAIVDSAESTAKVVQELLQQSPLRKMSEPERRRAPRIKFFVTDSVEKFRRLGSLFLGREIGEVKHVGMAE